MPIRITAALFTGKDTPSAWFNELVGDLSVSRHTSWHAFEEAIRDAHVAGVLVPVLDDVIARRITALRSDRPSLPLVIVALLTEDNSRALNRLPRVEAILLDDEVTGNLRGALNTAAAHNLLLHAADWIDAQAYLPELLRDTFAMACRKRRPVRSVDALSRTVLGDSRQALWELWHECMPEGTKPHGFVDWLLVAHAIAFTSQHESERAAAMRLGVKQATLHDAIRRRFGNVTFDELKIRGVEAVVDNLKQLLHVNGT